MSRVMRFIKGEVVLTAAILLAVVSMFLVPPDAVYFSYIDFRTLSILFCLMAAMAGFQQIGLFHFVAELLLKKVLNNYVYFINSSEFLPPPLSK